MNAHQVGRLFDAQGRPLSGDRALFSAFTYTTAALTVFSDSSLGPNKTNRKRQ